MSDNGYKKNSLSLTDAVSMGTGVMIGAGIFALTGQIAEISGALFPYVFLAAAVVAGFSAYSYVKLADAYPSAGGIGMFLVKAYGKGLAAAVFALMMAFSMVINESLVARTFGTYALQPFDVGSAESWLVPALGVGVLLFAFGINLSGNNVIGKFSLATAIVKIGGVLLFAVAALWVAGNFFEPFVIEQPPEGGVLGFVAATALGVLAYKGFTTITNSGEEIKDPRKNIGRAIVISLGICTVVYLLVALAVGANLNIEEIIRARDFALAEAARPALGQWGLWFTVAIAIAATTAGLIASTFAVSRMLAMLTDMDLIPETDLGLPGSTQQQTLLYVVVAAITLTIFLDLSRIASLGAILYLIMDIAIHWGVLKHLQEKVEANNAVVITAIVLDVIAVGAFCIHKFRTDPLILGIAAAMLVLLFLGERWFLSHHDPEATETDSEENDSQENQQPQNDAKKNEYASSR
ncbi:MAG: APC family permease [Armatimonadaceae bacterium]